MAQSAKDYLAAEKDRLVNEAKSITEKAEQESRSVTSEEREQVQSLLSQIESKRQRIQEIEDNEELQASIEKLHGTTKTTEKADDGKPSSLGDAFIRSQAYKALKASGMSGKWTTGPVQLPDVHAATVTTTASPIVAPDYRPGIDALPLKRLTVADLLMTGTTDSNQVTYAQEASETNAADSVAEAAAKPESTIVLALVNEAVQKIATFLPVADEMLEDVAQLRSFLDNRLRQFVLHAEEEQLLNGSGTAPDISGILDRTGLQTSTRALLAPESGSPLPDAFYQAITNIRVNALVEPDGIVVHPTNWAIIRMSKDANEQYYGGGPFTGAYGTGGGLAPDTLWGLRVVVTPAIAVNTALVGAFGTKAQVFRKSGLTVEASNSHNDFFQKNLTAIRAEERLALAVYRPNAFHAITALQTAAV